MSDHDRLTSSTAEEARIAQANFDLRHGIQRPSPEGLHVLKGQFETLPEHDERVDDATAPHVIYCQRALIRNWLPRRPLRCRIGWHRWGSIAWSRAEAEAARPGEFVRAVPRCTRCGKERP